MPCDSSPEAVELAKHLALPRAAALRCFTVHHPSSKQHLESSVVVVGFVHSVPSCRHTVFWLPEVLGKKEGSWGRSVCVCDCVQVSSDLPLFVTDGEPEPADGKIMFRKPAKRSSEKSLDFNVSSSKKMKEAKKTKREAAAPQSTAKQVKNSSLLSFDDEENDD